jgi:GntR family transcriptional regulator/MocR family aminotransferase
LALELRVARNTVLRAFDRLKAEGLVEGRAGSGVRVIANAAALCAGAANECSLRTEDECSSPLPFAVEAPPVDVFPVRAWARIAARKWRTASRELIELDLPCGYGPLREVIAEYLRRTRGVSCSARQLLITSGARHAVEIVARALIEPGANVWVESPGSPDVHQALRQVGATVIPVPVDRQGFKPSVAAQLGAAKVVALAPGCHRPSGVPLSMKRRQQIVNWAHASGGWIIEDDRFGVVNFVGRPLPTLHSLDRSARTIFIGSFAQVLFPGLRVGYAVVPESLVDRVLAARPSADQHAPNSTQASLAEFIEQGHFAQHLHRLREVIAARYEALAHGLTSLCGHVLDPWPASAGMHAVAWLPSGYSEMHVVRAAERNGVTVTPLRAYGAEGGREGVVLGFGRWPVCEIADTIPRLAKALDDVRPRGNRGAPAAR